MLEKNYTNLTSDLLPMLASLDDEKEIEFDLFNV